MSTAQASRALDRANEVTAERTRLLGGGYKAKLPPERVAELIEACPPALATMEILKLIERAHGFGARRGQAKVMRSERLLAREGITTNRQLGSLSERERQAVALRLTEGVK